MAVQNTAINCTGLWGVPIRKKVNGRGKSASFMVELLIVVRRLYQKNGFSQLLIVFRETGESLTRVHSGPRLSEVIAIAMGQIMEHNGFPVLPLICHGQPSNAITQFPVPI